MCVWGEEGKHGGIAYTQRYCTAWMSILCQRPSITSWLETDSDVNKCSYVHYFDKQNDISTNYVTTELGAQQLLILFSIIITNGLLCSWGACIHGVVWNRNYLGQQAKFHWLLCLLKCVISSHDPLQVQSFAIEVCTPQLHCDLQLQSPLDSSDK